MPSESTWPPPPIMLHPLAEHDAFLTALICAPKTKAPMSRLRLVRELRLATGKDLRLCLAVVNDYCDRYGVFPLRRGWRLWLTFLPSLVQFGLIGMLLVSQIVQKKNIAAAPTQAARHLLRWEHVQWDFILLGLILASALVSLFMVGMGRQWAFRDAEQARKKIASRVTAEN